MKVYRNYYGASIDRGIGVQSQSAEIKQFGLDGVLQELSSMHALESSEHAKEMLSYLVNHGTYSILGVSYTELPKSSGYNRSAPCGIQYVIPEKDLEDYSTELGSIVNFVSFQKPDSSTPLPLSSIPRNESGYTFHNSPTITAPIVDGLVHVALSSSNEMLVIALPKGKNSEYATARYTIAELLCYLPATLRTNIRFFTGLPVQEGRTEPIEGLENAIRFGANVVFCPNEYFRTLTSHRNCYSVDMDQPSGKPGAFARYITNASDISDGLATVLSYIDEPLTYERLNKAAEQAQNGERVSIERLQGRLAEAEHECRQLERELQQITEDYRQLQRNNNQLKQHYESLKAQNEQLDQQNAMLNQQNSKMIQRMEKQKRNEERQQPDYIVEKESPKALKILLLTCVALILMCMAVITYNGMIRGMDHLFDFSRIEQKKDDPSGQGQGSPFPDIEDYKSESPETIITPSPEDVLNTEIPTPTPTEQTTDAPTNEPSINPTAVPAETPTDGTFQRPTAMPTAVPTDEPAEGFSGINDSTNPETPEGEPARSEVTPAPKEVEAETAMEKVLMRPQPSTDNIPKIRIKDKGTRVTVLEMGIWDNGEEWYKVKYGDDIGYIKAILINLIGDPEQ